MRLLNTDTLCEAKAKLNRHFGAAKTVEIAIEEAYGRVLARDIYAECDVPGFVRSIVDGYAAISSDTFGVSESSPAFLKVIGEIEMGQENVYEIHHGECMYVPTGGMLPKGADTMIMVEYAQEFTDDQIAIYESGAPGRGIVGKDDECKAGALIFEKGHQIRPQDLGILAAIGCEKVCVYQKRSAYIISTGDELVRPGEMPKPGQVRDVNTYTLIGEVQRAGFELAGTEVVRDEEDTLKARVKNAMELADIILVSGGSSQGKKDATGKIVDELCSTGVLTHGITVKPGKPTIIGYDEPTDTVLIGLPGHPVGALMVFKELFEEHKAKYKAVLAQNVAAAPGRETLQPVKVVGETTEGLAKIVPVRGKSGIISTMVNADGYIVMDLNCEGLNTGALVQVYEL